MEKVKHVFIEGSIVIMYAVLAMFSYHTSNSNFE